MSTPLFERTESYVPTYYENEASDSLTAGLPLWSAARSFNKSQLRVLGNILGAQENDLIEYAKLVLKNRLLSSIPPYLYPSDAYVSSSSESAVIDDVFNTQLETIVGVSGALEVPMVSILSQQEFIFLPETDLVHNSTEEVFISGDFYGEYIDSKIHGILNNSAHMAIELPYVLNPVVGPSLVETSRQTIRNNLVTSVVEEAYFSQENGVHFLKSLPLNDDIVLTSVYGSGIVADVEVIDLSNQVAEYTEACDFNGDGIIDEKDISALTANLGRSVENTDYRIWKDEYAKYDVNQDGKITGTDLQIVRSKINTSAHKTVAIKSSTNGTFEIAYETNGLDALVGTLVNIDDDVVYFENTATKYAENVLNIEARDITYNSYTNLYYASNNDNKSILVFKMDTGEVLDRMEVPTNILSKNMTMKGICSYDKYIYILVQDDTKHSVVRLDVTLPDPINGLLKLDIFKERDSFRRVNRDEYSGISEGASGIFVSRNFIYIFDVDRMHAFERVYDYYLLDTANSTIFTRERYDSIKAKFLPNTEREDEEYSQSYFYVWNIFDEYGHRLGIPRLPGEKNVDFKRRLLTAASDPADETFQGSVNGMLRQFDEVFKDTTQEPSIWLENIVYQPTVDTFKFYLREFPIEIETMEAVDVLDKKDNVVYSSYKCKDVMDNLLFTIHYDSIVFSDYFANNKLTDTKNHIYDVLVEHKVQDGAGNITKTKFATELTYARYYGDDIHHAVWSLDGEDSVDSEFRGLYRISNVVSGVHTVSGVLSRLDNTTLLGASTGVSFTTVPQVITPANSYLEILTPIQNSVIVGKNIQLTYQKNDSIIDVDHIVINVDGGSDILDTDMNGKYVLTNIPHGNHNITAYLSKANDIKIDGSDISLSIVTVESLEEPTEESPIVITQPVADQIVVGQNVDIRYSNYGTLQIHRMSDKRYLENPINGYYDNEGIFTSKMLSLVSELNKVARTKWYNIVTDQDRMDGESVERIGKFGIPSIFNASGMAKSYNSDGTGDLDSMKVVGAIKNELIGDKVSYSNFLSQHDIYEEVFIKDMDKVEDINPIISHGFVYDNSDEMYCYTNKMTEIVTSGIVYNSVSGTVWHKYPLLKTPINFSPIVVSNDIEASGVFDDTIFVESLAPSGIYTSGHVVLEQDLLRLSKFKGNDQFNPSERFCIVHDYGQITKAMTVCLNYISDISKLNEIENPHIYSTSGNYILSTISGGIKAEYEYGDETFVESNIDINPLTNQSLDRIVCLAEDNNDPDTVNIEVTKHEVIGNEIDYSDIIVSIYNIDNIPVSGIYVSGSINTNYRDEKGFIVYTKPTITHYDNGRFSEDVIELSSVPILDRVMVTSKGMTTGEIRGGQAKYHVHSQGRLHTNEGLTDKDGAFAMRYTSPFNYRGSFDVEIQIAVSGMTRKHLSEIRVQPSNRTGINKSLVVKGKPNIVRKFKYTKILAPAKEFYIDEYPFGGITNVALWDAEGYFIRNRDKTKPETIVGYGMDLFVNQERFDDEYMQGVFTSGVAVSGVGVSGLTQEDTPMCKCTFPSLVPPGEYVLVYDAQETDKRIVNMGDVVHD